MTNIEDYNQKMNKTIDVFNQGTWNFTNWQGKF